MRLHNKFREIYCRSGSSKGIFRANGRFSFLDAFAATEETIPSFVCVGRPLRPPNISLRDTPKILGNLSWAIQAIPFTQGHFRSIQRFYISESHISALKTQNGPFFQSVEQTAGQFCQLGGGGSAEGSGNGCLQHELEMVEGIRLPAFLPDPEMPGQNNEGPGGIDVSDSATTRASLRTGPDSSERELVGRTVRSTTSSIRVASASRVEIIRSNFEAIGVSNQVVSFLLGGTRDSTCASYQSAWNGWRDWNIRRGSDPLSPNVTDVLEFLSFLATNGKAYRTVNVYRSMLSSTLGKLDGVKIGKHPLVARLLKGIYNNVPTTPKYTGFLDVSTVTRYLSSLGQNEFLSFNDLSLK